MEPYMVYDQRLLHPDEASFIRETAAYDDSSAAVAFQERLDLGIDYYYAVKHQITSIQRVWDAIIDEKCYYDVVGWFERSRGFIDSFRLCSYLIPQRVSIGFLGLCEGILQPSFDYIPGSSQPAPYHSESSTAVNTPIDSVEYEEPIGGERYLSNEEEYLEAFALSPTLFNSNFEDADNGRVEIISILSDDDDDNTSEENDNLLFLFEFDDDRKDF